MLTDEERAARSAEVIELLGLDRRRIRLLTAIHEAGHAVVANTVGALVISANVTSDEQIGIGDDYTHLDMPGGVEIPFPEYLTILAAGFQASYFWMEARGFGDTATLNKALNLLGASDWNTAKRLCQRWNRPELSMQNGIRPAGSILLRRWPTVLRIGYDLARLGTMRQSELCPHLISDSADRRRKAHEVFQQWRGGFDPASKSQFISCFDSDDGEVAA